MKLYIRQKVFSWTDQFKVLDESGQEKYTVQGEFSLAKKLHIRSGEGREVAYIEGKLFSWLPRYRVYVDGVQMAEIVKEMTFAKPKYRIEGPGWVISGDIWEHDYQILCGEETVAAIHKEWMSWGDCYELNIADGAGEIGVLAAALAIDCAMGVSEFASY